MLEKTLTTPLPCPDFAIKNLSIALNPASQTASNTTVTPLISHLDWQVQAGERWVILGANGCGKSSLLHACAGLPLQGRSVSYESIRFGTQVFSDKHRPPELHALASLRSYCPQRLEWNAQLTPRQLASLLSIDIADTNNLIFQAADLPAHWLNQAIGKRSGGEQQRIALALTLANPAPIVFLDEPLSHLDEVQQLQTLALLKRSGKTIVMVSHHIRLSLGFASHVLMPTVSAAHTKPKPWLAGTCSEVVSVVSLANAYGVDKTLAAQLLAG